MSSIDPGTTKFTVMADEDLCNEIRNNLHHGQSSELFRALLETIGKMFKTDGRREVLRWLYVGGDLILPERKEHKE